MKISTHRAKGALRVSKKYLERKWLESEGGLQINKREVGSRTLRSTCPSDEASPSNPHSARSPFKEAHPFICQPKATETRLMPVWEFGV